MVRPALWLLFAGATLAAADERLDITGAVDARWVHSDSAPSFLDGGRGILRFDAGHDGLRLGRAFASLKYRLTDTVSLHAVADAYGDRQGNAVDFSEFWLDIKPFPTSALRWRARIGAFYLPVSFENRGPGWTSVYSVTPSALNTWIGDELRTVGAEVEARWLGASSGYAGDLSFVAAAYGWNDPAGAVLAFRGFALTDRPSTLRGGLGTPRVELYHEIDGRPGYYAGLGWRHGERLELRTLYYDNRADAAAEAGNHYAWLTRFVSAGARFEPSPHWTFIAQHLDGYTVVDDEDAASPFRMNFRTQFMLGSFERGRERFSLRYDRYRTHHLTGFYFGPPSNQDGHAWTLGWTHRFSDQWELAAEHIEGTSRFPPRASFGLQARQAESQSQLAVRYRFDASL
ncbi:MAG: hypothetical protein RLZZ200_1495 [Pseudomonadota bacterium]